MLLRGAVYFASSRMYRIYFRTPLHCAASCNSVHLCKLLVESGAAIFASTISDIETAADKCEEMEEGYIQCSQFLYGELQEKIQAWVENSELGLNLRVYSVFGTCFSLKNLRIGF